MSTSTLTRQFIIEQAAPLFNKQGYAGTALADLLVATGLSKGALYSYFASENELALAAFDHNLALINQGLWPASGTSTSAVEQLLAVPRFYRNAYPFIIAAGGCPLLNVNNAEAVGITPPVDVQQRVQQCLRDWLSNLASIIQVGQERGEIRGSADAATYAALIVALVEGGLLVASSLRDSAALEDTLRYVEKLIYRDLAC